MWKTLYKKDSKDKIRIWRIRTDDSTIIQQSGILDGKLAENKKEAKAKNIGKINETTPVEQAKLELESEYKSKLDEGYFKTIKEANEEEVILPMLAKSYKDYSKKVDWKLAFVQPKLDGMRCLCIIKNDRIKLKSRDGKTIEGLDHIIKELCKLPDGIYDGELYCHGVGFQENMRLIKKYRPGETENIKYCIYDFMMNNSYDVRYSHIDSIFKKGKFNSLELVPAIRVYDESDLKKQHKVYLQDSYEGTILRQGTKSYGINKRCDSLLKYKDFQDIALPIYDIIPSEQRPNWGQFVFYWKGASYYKDGDNLMSTGMKFSHEEREEFLKNKQKYIGKTVEIRYFELSDYGVPRFPISVGFRNDKIIKN